MKRKIGLLLATTIAATSFMACSLNNTESVDEPIEEKVEETPVTDDDSLKTSDTAPEYGISSITYDTDSEYFTGSMQTVEITDDGHADLAKAVDEEFSKLVKSFNETSEEYVEEAESLNNYTDEDEESSDETDEEAYVYYYYYDVTATVTRADSSIFSIELSTDVYTGGAHGGHIVTGLVFDSKTGELLSTSDLGDILEDAKNYIYSNIDESNEDYTAGLFEEYQDTIETAFSEEDDTVYSTWLDDRGLVICFSEYSIAPYAMGLPTFTIPYSELSGFNSDYLPDDSFYIVEPVMDGLTENADINDDGVLESIWVVSEYNADSGYTDLTFNIGNESIEISDENFYGYSNYYVNSSQGDYVFIVGTSENGWPTTYMYSVSDGVTLIMELDDYGISSIEDGKMTIYTIKDAIGTWTVTSDVTYGDDGITFGTSGSEKINNNPSSNPNAVGLTLLQGLEYSASSNDFSTTATLEKGTVIYPTLLISNDSGSVMGFVAEDGTLGYFVYEEDTENGGYMVNGVNEYELFENIPYAG